MRGFGQTEDEDHRKKNRVKRAKGRGRIVEEILQKLEETFTKDQRVKATLGDYIRLVQLRRELGDDEPEEIKVTWVDRTEKESDTEK